MIKQVIIIRKDLGMRRGKECAQVAHSSMLWIIDKLKNKLEFTIEEKDWLFGDFTKVVLQVSNLDKLLEIYNFAKESNLLAYLVTDLGKTEFNEPTITCLAIGPDKEENINKITGELKLY